MENESNKRFESVYSTKVRAGRRRTYFFDVRKTKGEDFYVTLTESTKRFNGEGYERHKIFLYKEDFNRFVSSLQETIDHVKNDLMPDYDYDEFTKRQEEWEAKRASEELEAEAAAKNKPAEEVSAEATDDVSTETVAEESDSTETEAASEEISESAEKKVEESIDSVDDDISW